MKNVEIRLTSSELYVGAIIGACRRVASLQNGNDKNKHAAKSDWATDADGACAEIAASKFYGIYWEAHVNVFNERPDLTNGHNVRSTCHNGGHLIIRPNDNATRIIILVICRAPLFRLVGSIVAGDGQQEDFFRSGQTFNESDAWWVPQDRLNDLPERS